ncbi:MAG: hypothetical protein ACI4PI_00430 [Oscillospiraceae bacterium]
MANFGRVSDSMYSRAATNARATAQSKNVHIAKNERQGKKRTYASEDYVAEARSRSYANDHFKKSIELSKIETTKKMLLEPAENSITAIDDQLTKVHETVVKMGKIALDGAQAANLKLELQNERDQILNALNTNNGYGYIFGGGTITQRPFTLNEQTLQYHGQNLNTITDANLLTPAALEAVTGTEENITLTAAEIKTEVTTIGAKICGHGRLNFTTGNWADGAAGPLGVNEVSGDCISVLNKMINLMDNLVANPNHQASKDQINICGTYLKDTIQKKTISEARIANANAQKSLESCQEFLKNHMDASKSVISSLDLVDVQERDAIEMDNYMSNLSALSYQRIGLGMNRELIELMRNIVNM